ncbi:hypothetical protein PHMEG_0004292 [Phytophthora megakarya]|uniref:Uncharacterized protein n=1 Tax=Phytophthora megakarya TaxID=4795 RepID=A0A225WVU8_9STRA|nr:hypothetical protein PHMEG_0004292 [Phytophthora megakarya]
MSFLRFVLISTFIAVFTALVSGYYPFKGNIKFYAGENYNSNSLFLHIKLNTTNRCYSLDCSMGNYLLKGRTASVNWTGLPTLEMGGSVYLVLSYS